MWCQEMSISAIEGIGNSLERWGGVLSAQILTKCMKHNWNDHRGGVGGVRKHPFSDNLEH